MNFVFYRCVCDEGYAGNRCGECAAGWSAGSSSGGGKNAGRKGGNTTKGGEKGGDLETLARMQREFAAYIKTHASMADPPSVGANTKVVWL